MLFLSHEPRGGGARVLGRRQPLQAARSGVWTTPSDFTLVQFQYEPVPEPGTYAMLGAGLLVLGWLGRRRKTS
jgi:hypothetical protein